MANIMINEICNLNCSYCFADNYTQNRKNKKNISIEDFKKAIEFITTSGPVNRVGIIGGEPTLHPEFQTLIKLLIKNPKVKKAVIFTNGLEIDRYFELLKHPKIHMLINCNSPNDIGNKLYQKLKANLDYMVDELYLGYKMKLGINMYKKDFDYEYIIELLKRYGFKKVRISISIPRNAKCLDPIDYFKWIKPSVFNFFSELEKNNVVPDYDCNIMPPCVITDNERRWLKSLVSKSKNQSNLLADSVCYPVIDITPDLKAVRCLGLSDRAKVDIKQFKNITELDAFYRVTIDSFAFKISGSERCSNCGLPYMMKCMGGCLAYKINKIEAARELLIKFDRSGFNRRRSIWTEKQLKH